MADYFGWVQDDEAVNAVCAELPIANFEDTDANAITDLPDAVMPWKIKMLPPRNQGSVGSCTAFGTCRPIEYTNLIEISKGDKETPKSLSREINYAGGRVEIGGGRFRGSDGSTGAWASQCAAKIGTLDEGVYGSYDLRTYSPSRCKEWGNSGIPNDLEPLCANYKVGAITKVTTAEQALKSLTNGNFINVCSSRGFSRRRNADGICLPQGVWHHSMSIIGMKRWKDTWLFCIENSWGVASATGSLSDLPHSACFYADYSVVDGMLGQGDSWSYSNYAGFPLQNVDWKW